MAEFSFTPDVETPEIDSSEFSFTPDENQETAQINVKNYNGTSLVGELGEDAKPYSKMDLFLKNLFTFEVKSGEEVKENQANNPRIQALEKVKDEGFEGVKWGEVGKQLVKGSLELGKSITASPLKIYGDWAMDNRDTSLMTPKEADEVKFNNFRAQSYIKVGEYIEKIWDMGIKADWLKEDEETFKGSFVENPSMTRVLSLGASAIPSVGFFGGVSKVTGSRKVASILLAGADNDDLYFEAREAGESQNKALALYATGTAGTAALEKYGFDQIFNERVTAPLGKRILKAALSEGFTESFQAGYQNAVKKYGYDDTQELLEGVVESFIAGALSGGAISSADAGYIKLQRARGKLKEKGATDEALDMMQEEFARELSYHRDTIEPMFQTKITESLNNLEKFVKEHEGTAEAQKALKTKAELDEVYNLVNKSLTDNGVNAEVANADAKVWQGIALWGSQETGLSPMEYINQRMPKVQQKRLAEFLNEREKRVATSNESELEILRQDINRLKKGVSRKVSKGLRLSQFIKKMGGINDDRGDIKAMGSSVGLLNKNGISLDEATQMAWDAGYIQSTERPDVNQLLDLLSDDLGNKPVYSFNDNTKDDNRQYYLELERALDQAGADINKDSLEVINQKLNDYKSSFAREDVAQYNPELDDFIPFQGGVSGIELSGKELGNYQDANDLRRKAYKYFQDNLQGKYATHPVLGKIKFIRRGINKVKSTSADIDKLKLVPKIKEIIEGAEYLRSETPNKPHDGIVKFHYLSNSVMLEGNNISVFISIAEDNEGNFFYNINKDKNQPSQDTAVQMRSGEGVVDNSAINVNISPNRENVNRTFYQSAFAGSRVDYDRPSLEAIGSGEGQQVHGWGLYYALSKDVAEGYREAFTSDPYNTSWKIDEVPLNDFLGDLYNQETFEYFENVRNKIQSKDAQEAKDNLLHSLYDVSRMYYKKHKEGRKNLFTKDTYHNPEDLRLAELAEEKRDFVATLRADDISINQGQVHEVDIPENPYLLDEGLSFSEQSDFVKERIAKLAEDFDSLNGNTKFADALLQGNQTGKTIYNKLAQLLGDEEYQSDEYIVVSEDSKKQASKLLEQYGIKGITYVGARDGRCFVIFNPDDVKVIQKFYQDAGRPKGAFAQNLDQKGVIYLFEDADASTFMHETAHFFRKELEEFGTARSKEMLQKMIEWENSEFDKRYNVQQTANGFVVTDKLGNVVYGDKKPFQSVQSAREYGRNEIFARGFEQYLRDGKAPSNYLKQAFRSFWSWLRSLYKSAKDLNVEINDNIRSVYNEIIGGADLDFYLSAPVDEVLQQRVAETKDREEYLEDVIKRAQAKPYKGVTGWVKEKTESNKGLVKWWNAAIVPISTRAKRVNIKLRNRLRAYDYAVNNKYNEYLAQVKPFLDKWEKFSEQDAIAFDLALKNSYMKKQIDIVNKYGAYEEFVQVKNLLNRLFDQAIDVGVELGYTADYFPRQVEDVDGFMAYLHGSAMASQMRRALKDADPTNTFTNEEKAEFINKYLRGFNRRDLNKPLPGNTKDRIIDVITPEMNKYYKPSIQALISYIDGMNQSIESRRFWGFEYESINDSIGSLTSYLVDTGVIQPEQDAEVQEILKARFKAKGVTNKYLKKQKNLSYIYLMGGINSAITQIEDISVAIYKAGFWNTATSVFSKNRKGLSREELGLEKIGQEFVEASTSSQAVSTVFKLTGLDKIDAFGKNTLINATFNKFQDMANKDEDALRARLEPILEQETNQTIQDIKNGEISENVKLLMFNELADMQPISLSEMPEWYLTSGNGRVFYMLKTFALKRIDIFRNECFDKIRQGDVKTGIQNLFRLSMIMILCGMSKDAIINMLFGRDMDLSEMFINNLLGLTGIVSKYSLYKARDEGFSGFLSSVAIPPLFAMPSDLIGDIYKSLFTAKGKDISDYEVWKGIPLVGRFYYWWLGGGRTKIEKKKNKKLK